MNWQTHFPYIFGIDLNVTFIRFVHLFSVLYLIWLYFFKPALSFESSSQKSMIIGSMTLISMQFYLQYSFLILTTCSSAFVHTSFVFFSKAAYVNSLASFNRKVVLFLAKKSLTCAHINSIRLSSVSNGGSYYFRVNCCVV